LAAASRIDEVKAIKDKAIALELYGRQAKDKDIENWAAEIKLRANRRLGEISAALPTAQGARKDKGTWSDRGTKCKKEILAEAGLSNQDADRAEQVAAIPEKEFEEVVWPRRRPNDEARWQKRG
jgi:hypothetical protein